MIQAYHDLGIPPLWSTALNRDTQNGQKLLYYATCYKITFPSMISVINQQGNILYFSLGDNFI